MKRTINFGKIDFNGTGRKINSADVTVELRGSAEKPVLSICGTVWNARHTDCVCGGQCLDQMLPYFKTNARFKEIYRLWKLYHLNDMHAGDREQEDYLNKNMPGRYNYDTACKLLKDAGLYEHNGYKYGHGWIYEKIPENDLKKIQDIIDVE